MAAASDEPPHAAGPESLSVQVVFVTPTSAPQFSGVQTLAELFADPIAGQQSPDLRLALADTPSHTPPLSLPRLNDVLLRRAPLPGFGVLPAAWIPEETRRRALLLHTILSSPDASALARMMRALNDLPDEAEEAAWDAVTDKLRKLLEFALCTGARWSPEQSAATHELALHELATGDPRRGIVVAIILGALARTKPAPLPSAVLLPLIPKVLALLAFMADDAAEYATTIFETLSWLVFVSQAGEATDITVAIGADTGIAVLARVAEEVFATLQPPYERNDVYFLRWTTLHAVMELLLIQLNAAAADATAAARFDGLVGLRILGCVADAMKPNMSAMHERSWPMVSNMLGVGDLVLNLMAVRQPAPFGTHTLSLAFALVSKSPALQLAVRLWREQAESECRADTCVRMWTHAMQTPEAWPGGAAALVALAQACGLLAVLTPAHVNKLRRTQFRAKLSQRATELQGKVRAFMCDAAAADAGAAAADAAAAALLAEEEAANAQASKQAAAKARKAERKAEERRARAEAEAAAAAAQQAAEEQAAAAQAEQRHLARQARRDNAHAHQPPPPPPPPPAVSTQPAELQATERVSDARIAELFPWLTMRDDAPAAPRAVAAAAAAAAAPAHGDEEHEDDGCCVICLDADKDTALQPCGHGVLCSSCAAKVLAKAAPTCPMCRAPALGCSALG